MASVVRVSVQGRFVDRPQWLELAKTVDRSDIDCLYVADHPGSTAAPFVALAAAAAVTERVRLGTCVANAGLWEPLSLAAELATLDAASSGRALFGIGAGHAPYEWTALGSQIPRPGARVERLVELVAAVRLLLGGEPVTISGGHFELHDAVLRAPKLASGAIRLLVGGNGRRVLSFGATCADIVGVTGLGRTLSDGHSHAVKWSRAALEGTFSAIASAASRAGRRPDIEALVQRVEITDDAYRAAKDLARAIVGATVEDLLEAPFSWIGTPEQIVEKLLASKDRFGINRYVIRDSALEAARPVLEALKSSK